MSSGAVGDGDDFVSRFVEESLDERGGDEIVFDEQHEHGTVGGTPRHFARRRRARQRGDDLVAHALGLRARLAFELAAEDVGAFLITAQRRVGTPLLELQPHQRAMHDFLRRIEREKFSRGLDRALPPAGIDLRGEQPPEDRHRAAPIREAAFSEPVIERLNAGRKTFEQIAAIDIRGVAHVIDRW